jgi:hypothetical protein
MASLLLDEKISFIIRLPQDTLQNFWQVITNEWHRWAWSQYLLMNDKWISKAYAITNELGNLREHTGYVE